MLLFTLWIIWVIRCTYIELTMLDRLKQMQQKSYVTPTEKILAGDRQGMVESVN